MRMESKRSIIRLLIIMILIYIQHSVIICAQEPVTMYELTITENTGKNGYYVKKPEVKIVHTDMVNLTKYQLLRNGEILEEGELTAEVGEATIGENVFNNDIYQQITIYVPTNIKSNYILDAGWKSYSYINFSTI